MQVCQIRYNSEKDVTAEKIVTHETISYLKDMVLISFDHMLPDQVMTLKLNSKLQTIEDSLNGIFKSLQEMNTAWDGKHGWIKK